MVNISLKHLLDGTEMLSLLREASRYTGFSHISRLSIEKNKNIYSEDSTYDGLDDLESFYKDILTAVDYTDYCLLEHYKPYTGKYKTDHINWTQLDIALYTASLFSIVFEAYGRDYFVGLTREQHGFIRSLDLLKNGELIYFDDLGVQFALEILGGLELNQPVSKNKNIPQDSGVLGF